MEAGTRNISGTVNGRIKMKRMRSATGAPAMIKHVMSVAVIFLNRNVYQYIAVRTNHHSMIRTPIMDN
jgi:hypothetical protein